MAYLATPPSERFWPKINKNGPIHPYDPSRGRCWDWTLSVRSGGYGQFWGGPGVGVVAAHRYAWEETHGPIPDGLVVRHSCDRPACVNAETHLLLGTQAENCADLRERGNPFGGKIQRCGEASPRAKISEIDVIVIRARYVSGETITALATAFGLGTSQIWRIVTNQSWAHLSQPNREEPQSV